MHEKNVRIEKKFLTKLDKRVTFICDEKLITDYAGLLTRGLYSLPSLVDR